ncbi:MAG: hypothetical protein ACI4XD_00080 [Clostridia bacterium]
MSTNVQINVVSADMEKDSLKMKGAGMLKEPTGEELSVIHVKPGIKRDSNIYGEDGQLVAKLNGRDGREK